MSEQVIESDDVFTDSVPEELSRSGRLTGTLNLEPGFRGFLAKDEQKVPELNVIDIFIYVRSCFNDVQTLQGLLEDDILNQEAWSAWKAHKMRSKNEDTEERTDLWKQHMNYLLCQNIESEALFDHASNPIPLPI